MNIYEHIKVNPIGKTIPKKRKRILREGAKKHLSQTIHKGLNDSINYFDFGLLHVATVIWYTLYILMKIY